MTTADDTPTRDADGADAPSPGPAAKRPSPSSRARRIGGLTRPGSRATAPSPPAPAEDAAPAAASTPATDVGPAASPEPAVDVTTADTPAAPPRSGTTGETPAWLRWLPATALGAAAVVMLVFFAVSAHGVWWGRPSANAVRDEVLSAAKGCFAQANTYHYTSLAADEAKGAACATGAYARNYHHVMDTVIKPQAAQKHVVQIAQVTTAGISQISPNGKVWTVLVVGQLKISATSLPNGRTDPVAALVQLVKVDGRWRISTLREVSGPTG